MSVADPDEHPSGNRRIFVVAGDPSGDVHGAMLVREIRSLLPDAWYYGVCGRQMRRAGVAPLADSTGFSAIGVAGSLPKIPRLVALFAAIKRHLRANPPHLVILIDFPAFNMRVLRFAHDLGVPTLYYFPPASWRREPSKPAARVAALATAVATPFEWSARILNALGGNAHWVGHPVIDRYAQRPSEARARGLLSIPLTALPVAVLPGSRPQELRYVLPLLLEALRRARETVPDLMPIVSCGPGADRSAIEEAVEERLGDGIVTEDTLTLLSACRGALTKSGTITLDAAACGVPMVITYAGSWFDHLQYRLFAKGRIKYIGAPNILLGREVAPERYAETGQPKALAEALIPLLRDGPEREACRQGLAEAVELLGEPGASRRTAQIAADLAEG